MAKARQREMDIEQVLIWAHQVERVHKARVRAGVGGGCDSVVRVEARAMGGGTGSGASWMAQGCHPDAEAVHNALGRLSLVQRQLVEEHAIAGSRPDWLPGARVVLRPVVNGKGKPAMICDDHKHAVACQVVPAVLIGSVERWRGRGVEGIVQFHRDLYRAWWTALADLAETLELDAIEVAGFAAPAEPWLSESGMAIDKAQKP